MDIFCHKCGTVLPDAAQFCHICGIKTIQETDSEVLSNGLDTSKEALIRKTKLIAKKWNIYPTLPGTYKDGITDFNCEHIRSFDPLYSLNQLKRKIIDTCMEETAYRFDETYFNDVLHEVFGKQEKVHQRDILVWLIESFNRRIKAFRFEYQDLLKLRDDEYEILTYAYCIMYISCKLKAWEELLFARSVLRTLDLFQCRKNTSNPYFVISGNGHMLSLPQFEKDKAIYNQWLSFIERNITEYGTQELKKQLSEIQEKESIEQKIVAKESSRLAAAKIITSLIQPILCIFSGFLSELIGLPQDLLPSAIIVSVIIVMILSITTNIKAKSKVTVILFCIVYTLLFYPLCWVLSYAMVVGLLVGVAVVIGFYKFVRS